MQRRQAFSAYVKEVGGKLKRKEIRLKDVEAKEISYTIEITDTAGEGQADGRTHMTQTDRTDTPIVPYT